MSFKCLFEALTKPHAQIDIPATDIDLAAESFFSYVRFLLIKKEDINVLYTIFDNLYKLKIDRLMESFADAIISSAINLDQDLYYFYHLKVLEKSLKTSNLIVFNRTAHHISHAGLSKIIAYFKQIHLHLEDNKYKIYLSILNQNNKSNYFIDQIIALVPAKEKLNFWVDSLSYSKLSLGMAYYIDSDDSLKDLLYDNIRECGDKSKFAQALLNKEITIDLILITGIRHVITNLAAYMPDAIEDLFNRSCEEQSWRMMLHLKNCIDKKRILKELIKSNDKQLIDNFVRDNSDDPVIKKIIPFI